MLQKFPILECDRCVGSLKTRQELIITRGLAGSYNIRENGIIIYGDANMKI